LTFLVINNTGSCSSKNLAAKEFGITNISENEFYNILENPEKTKEYKGRGYTGSNIKDDSIIFTLDR